YHAKTVANIRTYLASCKNPRNVAIMLDTKGPEIRTGKLVDGKDVTLKTGSLFLFHNDMTRLGDATQVATTYTSLASTLHPGDRVLIDDGLIGTTVVEVHVEANEVLVRIDNDGVLGETKGVNLPGIPVDLPAITEKDTSDILFGVKQGIDLIAASFIRKASDVHEIRKLIQGTGIKIMSKIESQEGLDNFDEILDASDGIMVARGDLGVEVPVEQVARYQKMMIRKCNAAGKHVVTATQMLESMIFNPRPTRAEATDVANAVLDGSDCVMLSGETAKGAHPVAAVEMMGRICREAEADINYSELYPALRRQIRLPISISEAVASSAVKTSWDVHATLIIALTQSGNTAQAIAKYRPIAPVLAVTSSPQVARQCQVLRGIYPLLVTNMGGTENLVHRAMLWGVKMGMAQKDDHVVVTSGVIEGVTGSTNIMRVLRCVDPAIMEDVAPDSPRASDVDITSLRLHLERLLPVVLDADPQDVLVYIIKELIRANNGNGAAGPAGSVIVKDDGYSYSLQLELAYSDAQAISLALIKRSPVIDTSRPLQQQIHLINLPGVSDGANPYEALHSYIHNAVAPFFEAYVANKTAAFGGPRDEKDNKTGIPMAKKKIAELELSLLQLQQNVDVPEIFLNFHPLIQKAVEQCRSAETRVTVDAIGDAVNDSGFLNKLQADVNGWIKEIQKVTKLSRDPSTGTASQEINFWLSMERALAQIEEQLKSDQITLTLDVLKHAKRFHATVSFMSDTGLKEATDKVQRYNQLMRDFPLNELLSATEVDKIQEAVILVFGHLNKKLKLSPYPIKRALPFVDAISRDLNDQLLKVLGSRRLMYMEYDDFDRATEGCEEVCRTWEDQVKEFTNIAREVTRKRSEKIIPIKFNSAHTKLQERIKFVRAFRRQHEQLYNTILRVMKPDKVSNASKESAPVNLPDVNPIEDVIMAYESVKNIDVLDVSPEGTEIWVAAENSYNERVARVENQIIARLRDRLGTAKNANEMFRVFSKFNALFVRPKIRGAIQEYQAQLIDNVKEDIKRLHDKFKMHYRNSEAFHMSQLRDLPSISGAIIWARQIERQLGLYMNRVEDVLGKGGSDVKRRYGGRRGTLNGPDDDTAPKIGDQIPLGKLGSNSLLLAYETIEQQLKKVDAYVSQWLQYQSLWDLESEFVYMKLGDDLSRWQQLVLEIKKARSTFDNSETEKRFGSLTIDYDQQKVVVEDQLVEKKIKDIIGEWETSKPIQGSLKPDLAIQGLNIFEGRVMRLKEEYDLLCRAKEALDLDLTVNDRLEPILEELSDLKGVWNALAKVWQSLNELKETLWASVSPRKVKQQLDLLISSAKEMPNKTRQYAAFEFMQESLKGLLKVNPVIADLKSEALRERHWRQLLKALKLEGKVGFNELTVGHLWDADLKKNETEVRDIIVAAQGEMALEEFLKQVKE
ncbi:hypothetical protein HK405_002984, partial [Cladochytrium tenue]